MNKSEKDMLAEAINDMEGLQQLASWQLALVRDIRDKLTDLDKGRTDPRRAPRRRGRSAPGSEKE